jgi:hypothetical protein
MESNVVSFRTSEEPNGSGDEFHHVVASATTPVLTRVRKTAQRPPLPTVQVYYLDGTPEGKGTNPMQASNTPQAEPKARLTDLVFKSKSSKMEDDPFVKRLARLS